MFDRYNVLALVWFLLALAASRSVEVVEVEEVEEVVEVEEVAVVASSWFSFRTPIAANNTEESSKTLVVAPLSMFDVNVAIMPSTL
jgi:hypothetical protein